MIQKLSEELGAIYAKQGFILKMLQQYLPDVPQEVRDALKESSEASGEKALAVFQALGSKK